MKRIFTAFFVMLFAIGLIYAQAPSIILLTPDDRDDAQYEFLVNQGFDVTKFWGNDDPEATWSIATASQDTIDMLNAADLLIIGRSPQSGNFADSADAATWNGLTPPMIINSAYLARSTRLKMFDSKTAVNLTEEPEVGYGVVSDPADPIFANVSLDGDSLAWWHAPNTVLENADSLNNGTILVMYNGTIPLLARWDAGTEYYPGAEVSPAGPRVYCGMGNDAADPYDFFPLTKAAKTVYLAEIQTLLGLPISEPVFTPKDMSVILLTPDDRDDAQFEFLVNQGFNVTKFWGNDDPEASWSIATAGQDTIDMLNAADLLIIGRSPQSGNFADSADAATWNGLTPPLVINSAYLARSTRLKMFNSTTAKNLTEDPEVGYGVVLDPADPVFAGITLDGDSLAWWHAPNTVLENADSLNNGTILVMYNGTIPLLARWDAGTEYYPGAEVSPAGDRVYFGMGNDAADPYDFFPLTRDAQAIYLAELCRLVEIPVPKVTYTLGDFSAILLSPDNRDDAQMEWLIKNGLEVTRFWGNDDPEASWSIASAGQDTIDMLNAADLIIIGRSPQSGNFADSADVVTWNGLTPALIVNSPYLGRSSRLKMFNSTSVYHLNEEPVLGYGVAVDPMDAAFTNVTLDGDSLEWWMAPNDFLENADSLNNGTFVAMYNETTPLVARWDAGVEYYPGAKASPAGPRVYFGMGNDAVSFDKPNFFPLTADAQQVYLNEICNVLSAAMVEVVTSSSDATLASLGFDVEGATLTPAFDPGTFSYQLQLPTDVYVVDVIATATSDMARVNGDTAMDVSGGDPLTTVIVVTAETGIALEYSLTVIPPEETGLESEEAASAVKLYPNPVTGVLYVESDRDINKVTLYNVVGSVVLEQYGLQQERLQLDLGELQPGIYMIRLDSGKNSTISKFLKR